MKRKERRRLARENRRLEERLEVMDLDPGVIWSPLPEDAAERHRVLTELLDWVGVYTACPERGKLKELGYLFPPVQPDIDPDTDWLRFERWMSNEDVAWWYEQEFGPLKPAAGMTREEAGREFTHVVGRLASRNVVVGFEAGVPPEVAYAHLCKSLRESPFEYVGEGSHYHLTGCSGYCPECFQRAWCELGQEMDWPEDEEAGAVSGPAPAADRG